MDLHVHIVNFTLPGGAEKLGQTVADTAKAAEEAGCASVSVMDHYFQMEMGEMSADQEMLEGYTTLGFLAAHTERVRLGLLVTGVTYRHPGLLAKIVTTLDVLSQGRAELGVGAAWYEREHRGLGVGFPALSERFERLEETIRICKQMWSDNDGPFEGKHYQLAETINSPQPISEPRPPILIGGSGEKKTLRLVARYADACNLFASTPEEIAHKLDVLKGHCEAEDRDYDEIQKTMLYMGESLMTGDLDGFVEDMKAYADLGMQMVGVMPIDPDPVAWVERLGKVTPHLGDL